MPAPRILIVKLSSFGDILHALPLADSLRSALPDARIDWVVRENLSDLVDGHPGLDTVHRLPRKGFREGLELSKRLRTVGYDIALDIQGLFYSGWLAWLSGAPRRIGFDWNREGNRCFLTEPVIPAGDRVPMAAKILRAATLFGVSSPSLSAQTWLALAERESATDLLNSIPSGVTPIALVLGASTPVKTLSQERWTSLASRLVENGFHPVLVGGKGEESVAKAVASAAPSTNLAGRTSFRLLASVLEHCRATVGGDTGALHLAVAMGVPAVGLYGVTDPALSGPDWGAGPSLVLDAGPTEGQRNFRRAATGIIDRIREDEIVDAIQKLAMQGQMPSVCQTIGSIK